MEPGRTAQEFESLIMRIFEAQGFAVEREGGPGQQDRGVDFLARQGEDSWSVQVKYYRTRRPQFGLIEAAALNFYRPVPMSRDERFVLVVSAVVNRVARKRLEELWGIGILDLSDMVMWAGATPELVDELASLVELEASERVVDPEARPPGQLPGRVQPRPSVRAPIKTGKALESRLRALKPGKRTWPAHEKLCEEIFRYLFSDDLVGWHKQKRTGDGLNRFDRVCRVQPSTKFWKFLIEDLESRYVVLEFKNYSAKIKQGEILTTEKYLLARALRRVAIICSRKGGHQSAISASEGAMREHGKLMLILDDEQIYRMLDMKDRGADPSDYMFELTDDFLLSLPR